MVSTRPPYRVRLTDQALVAVAIARQRAAGHPRAVDLLAGLVIEQDGAAGQLLRDRASAAAQLAEQPPSAGGSTLDTVVRAAAESSEPRPVATLDLLYAALDAGGEELVGVLTAAGWDPGDLRAVPPSPAGETLGLGADRALSPTADSAVARTRAAGGGAVDLLYELAAGPDPDLPALDLPAVPPSMDAGDDAGLEAVLDAARTFRPDGTITGTDLLRAAVVAGGQAPRRLLEAADG